MAKTAAEAQKLTQTAEVEGKHHIGDFLPPEELSKFMDKYKVKAGHHINNTSRSICLSAAGIDNIIVLILWNNIYRKNYSMTFCRVLF